MGSKRADSKEQIQAALMRVEDAGVDSTRAAILAWIGAVGPTVILAATLAEIRDVAATF